MNPKPLPSDPTAEQRKKDHIDLAFASQVNRFDLDTRFYYEPLLAAHPSPSDTSFSFLGKSMKAPIWVSSMTGGTGPARYINQNLGRVCGEFGLGMGLGSTRGLLDDNTFFEDFNLRPLIGPDAPFFINLGIAQIEKLISSNSFDKVSSLINRLEADGLIIHINPMQEWLQPEGDFIAHSPLDTINKVISIFKGAIIIKEVGQGFGPASIKTLLQLPISAIDFAAAGGTNFAKLELLRSDKNYHQTNDPLTKIGHTAEEMVGFVNQALIDLGDKAIVKEIIISGGVQHFLDGYYLMEKLSLKSVYGQASAMLKHAADSYESLHSFVEEQIKGLAVAKAYLKVK
jgi:isopentenyl-diphosphate delta-isomerase